MPTTRREFRSGPDELPDLANRAQVQQAGLYALAAAIFIETFADRTSERVSRGNVLRGVAGIGELSPDLRTPLMRRLAEAWQLLELTGCVCNDPEETHSDWWFATAASSRLLSASDPIGTLKYACERAGTLPIH